MWATEASAIRDLLIVRYEDLRSDPNATLARIIEFMGSSVISREIEEAVRFSSVENMRNMETKRTFWLSGSRMVAKDKNNPDSFKVRKAKVGGYRDYFNEDQIRTMNDLVQTELNPLFGYQEIPVN